MKKSKLLAVMLGAVMIPTTLAVVGCGTPPPATLDLQGDGTQATPYLIATAADLDQITKPAADKTDLITGKYFQLTADIGDATNPYQTSAEDFNAIFDGILLGNDKTITMAGDTALFAENEGTIQNLTIAGNVNADTATGVVGMLANKNEGTIKNVNVGGEIVSTRGTVSDLTSAETNGVGGLVGLNDTTGKIEGAYSEAAIQAKVGGGGFAAINKGEIKNSYNRGAIGIARPSTNANIPANPDADPAIIAEYWTSNTINYSVLGGIAGINFGSILSSQNKSHVFAPALDTSAPDYSNTLAGNQYIGGIAGYNKANAVISESSANFGTAQNQIGSGTVNILIFGQKYVGGIAGYNDGSITYSMGYSKVGAAEYFGGIAGWTGETGTVKNSATSQKTDRGPLGAFADTTAALNAHYYTISNKAEDCAYNSESKEYGAVPTEGNAYVNCVTGFKNTSNISLLDTLNKGTELAPKWMYISGGTSANPAIQPVANAVATLTAITGDAANLKATTYGLSKFGGDSIDVQPNGNAPEGYTFAGWSSIPNGTEADILTDGQALVINWTLTAGQNIVVYAVYTENPAVE